jgi:hypothetical protein
MAASRCVSYDGEESHRERRRRSARRGGRVPIWAGRGMGAGRNGACRQSGYRARLDRGNRQRVDDVVHQGTAAEVVHPFGEALSIGPTLTTCPLRCTALYVVLPVSRSGFDAKGPRRRRALDGDVSQVFGVGARVDGAIAVDDHLVGQAMGSVLRRGVLGVAHDLADAVRRMTGLRPRPGGPCRRLDPVLGELAAPTEHRGARHAQALCDLSDGHAIGREKKAHGFAYRAMLKRGTTGNLLHATRSSSNNTS